MKYGKNLGLDQVLAEIKAGKTPAKISQEHGIPKQTLSYSTTRLKKLGCVEYNPETRAWKWIKEVPIRPKDTSKVNSDIRGHAFIWNIEFLEERIDWDQVVKNYKKRKPNSKLTFKKICNGKVNRILFKGKKIWLTKTGLTIYEPMDFMGKSSFSVKGTAVFEMDRLIKKLLKEFGVRFQYYRFKCSREHYAQVKNQLARQFNDNKQKIRVEHEGKWFWIDHSQGEHEEETNNPNTSVQAQAYYKDAVKEGFSQKHSVIKENFSAISENLKQATQQINQNAQNFGFYADNMVTHVAVMKQIQQKLSEMSAREERFVQAIEKLSKK